MFLYKALNAFTKNTAHSTDTHPVQVDTAIVVFSGWLFCPPCRSRRRSVFTNSLHAGLAAAAAPPVESSKADFIFVKWQVCKCKSQSWCLSPLFIPLMFFFPPPSPARFLFLFFLTCMVGVRCRLLITCLQTCFSALFFFFLWHFCLLTLFLFWHHRPICCMGRGWHRWTACSRPCLSRTVGMYR